MLANSISSEQYFILGILSTIAFGGFCLWLIPKLMQNTKKTNYLIEKNDVINNNDQKNDNNNNNINNNNKPKKPVRIYLDGCWDVMHSGHYNALRQAKTLGDILVVGVHSDEEIARNKREPVMNNEQRMAAVKACKWADEVVFDVPYAPSNQLLDELNCDYCAHGDDMPVAANGKSAYDNVKNRLKIFRRTPGISTTHLIQRLIDAGNQQNMIENSNNNLHQNFQNHQDSNNNNNNTNNNTNNPLNNNQTSATWSSFLPSSHRISAFSNGRVPKKDDVVIYIDGIFDLFHIGHISALKAAQKLGTFLYVGLYNDETVKKMLGDCFPIQSLQERVLNVLSCKYVDEVIIGCPWVINESTIKSLNISKVVLTKNTMIAKNELERYSIPKKLNILTNIETDSDFTTRKLMQKIINDREKLKQQNENRVEKAKKYVEDQTYVEEH